MANNNQVKERETALDDEQDVKPPPRSSERDPLPHEIEENDKEPGDQDDTSGRSDADADPDNKGGDGGGDDLSDAEAEKLARSMGWVPKSEWRGNPKHWRPAQEFLNRALSNGPIARERLQDMQSKLDDVTEKLGEATSAIDYLYQDRKQAQKSAYEQGVADAEKRKREAVKEGDEEAFEAAESDLKRLQETAPKDDDAAAEPGKKPDDDTGGDTDKKDEPEVPQEIIDWRASNPWYDKDLVLNNFATAFESQLAKDEPDLSLEERLERTTEETRKRFPDKFRNPRRDEPGAVNGPTAPRNKGGANARTYENLPAEAKAACDRFCRTIPGFTRDEYLKSYQWDQAQ